MRLVRRVRKMFVGYKGFNHIYSWITNFGLHPSRLQAFHGQTYRVNQTLLQMQIKRNVMQLKTGEKAWRLGIPNQSCAAARLQGDKPLTLNYSRYYYTLHLPYHPRLSFALATKQTPTPLPTTTPSSVALSPIHQLVTMKPVVSALNAWSW